MIIYPTIELKGGRCVSLPKGRIDEPLVWHVDPLQKAKEFARAGAEWIHITDFDAIGGESRNKDLITRIIHEAGAPVQLGGGFRSRDRIEDWIDRGVGRVVVGTLAAQNPHLVRELAERHADQIVLAVDVWQDHVMIEGWKTKSAFTATGYIESFARVPFAAILATDIGADIHETSDGTFGLISKMADVARVPVIASGVIKTLDDIARLRLLDKVSGAILGRALFNRSVTLADALREARPGREKVAAFI